jgi:hypothetical protein
MAYYHDLITEKSWKFLQTFKSRLDFTLIGGWAVYLYCKALKSKDIDIIANYEELEKLKNDYDLIKNDRLKKYEIHAGEFDVDIYTPFYSTLGIPAEDIQRQTRLINGFLVPIPEILLILKQHAWEDRKGSSKGEKDKIDIIAILQSGIDMRKYAEIIKKYGVPDYEKRLKALFNETRAVPELGLNEFAFSKLKKSCFLKTGIDFFIDTPEESVMKKKGINAVKKIRDLR